MAGTAIAGGNGDERVMGLNGCGRRTGLCRNRGAAARRALTAAARNMLQGLRTFDDQEGWEGTAVWWKQRCPRRR